MRIAKRNVNMRGHELGRSVWIKTVFIIVLIKRQSSLPRYIPIYSEWGKRELNASKNGRAQVVKGSVYSVSINKLNNQALLANKIVLYLSTKNILV